MASHNYHWKNAFKKNRVAIVRGLTNPDEVACYLHQFGIFNDEMYDAIKQTHEIEKKTRLILNVLTYRGYRGVPALYEAFIATQNEDLAKKLEPYIADKKNNRNKTEPTEWPPSSAEVAKMMDDHVIKIEDVTSPLLHAYGKDSLYDMQKECRGKVFIINNVKFGETLGNRDGSDKDAKNLTQLFEELHFSVQQRDNLTANEMKNYLYSEAGALTDDTDCVILIILSHGGGTRVYGRDHMPVELKTLTDYFSSNNCSTLYGKPRLVFVQACRSVESASIKKTIHVVKHHGEFEIECFVNTDKKILDVSWIKNAECIKVETSPNKYEKGDTESVKSLKVYNVEDSDKGKYYCIVKYEFEYRTNPSEIKLDMEDVEKASIKKSIYTVKPGTSQIEMECIIRPEKTVKDVFWEKEGDQYPIKNKPSLDKHYLDREKSVCKLIIKNVVARDKGKYRCIVNYDDGSKDQSNFTELDVDIQDVEIASIEKTFNKVKPGGQVEIECFVKTKNSIQKVFWEMDTGDVKREIMADTNKYLLKHDGKKRILIVKNVGISDVGKYRCIVKYESEYSSNITEVDVKHDAEYDVTETNAIEPRDESDSKLYQQKNTEEKSPKCTFPDHPSADFLIAYATPEGSQAWRHSDNGSWFINAIVWAFKYHAHEDELHHLLIRVNRLVGIGCTWSNDMTVAEVKSNLRKKVHFFPGVYGYPPQKFENNNLY